MLGTVNAIVQQQVSDTNNVRCFVWWHVNEAYKNSPSAYGEMWPQPDV